MTPGQLPGAQHRHLLPVRSGDEIERQPGQDEHQDQLDRQRREVQQLHSARSQGARQIGLGEGGGDGGNPGEHHPHGRRRHGQREQEGQDHQEDDQEHVRAQHLEFGPAPLQAKRAEAELRIVGMLGAERQSDHCAVGGEHGEDQTEVRRRHQPPVLGEDSGAKHRPRQGVERQCAPDLPPMGAPQGPGVAKGCTDRDLAVRHRFAGTAGPLNSKGLPV